MSPYDLVSLNFVQLMFLALTIQWITKFDVRCPSYSIFTLLIRLYMMEVREHELAAQLFSHCSPMTCNANLEFQGLNHCL